MTHTRHEATLTGGDLGSDGWGQWRKYYPRTPRNERCYVPRCFIGCLSSVNGGRSYHSDPLLARTRSVKNYARFLTPPVPPPSRFSDPSVGTPSGVLCEWGFVDVDFPG